MTESTEPVIMTPENRHLLENNKDGNASADREEKSSEYGKPYRYLTEG